MAIAEVLLSNLYDKEHDVNGVGTEVNGVMIRDRWNQSATVRVVDHPADSNDSPALFTNTARFKTWRLGKAKLGTAHVLYDTSGIDIVIPGADAIINPETPPPVTNFRIGLVTHNTLDLHWDPMWTEGDILGYHLEQLIVGEDADYIRIATLGLGVVTYVARNLPADALVRFRIRSYEALVGPWTLTEGVTDDEPVEILPPVDTGSITNTALNTQVLQWTYSGDAESYNNIDGYRVEKLEVGTDILYQPLAELPKETLTYEVTGLPSETLIFYRIRTENADEESIWKSDSETTLPDVPLEPPEWDEVPAFSGEERDLPIDIDLSTYVTSETDLVNWRYFPVIDELSINQDGLLTFTEDFRPSVNIISVSVDNDDGTGTSNTFQVEVEADATTPDEDVVVLADNFNRPNEDLAASGTGRWDTWESPLTIINEEVTHGQSSNNDIALSYLEAPISSAQDQFVRFTVRKRPTGLFPHYMGLTKLTGPSYPEDIKAYMFGVTNWQVHIARLYAVDQYDILSSADYRVQPGDVISGYSIDGVHELYVNNTLMITVENNVHNPLIGVWGLYSWDTDRTGAIDNFVAGNTSRVPSRPPINEPTDFAIAGISTTWARLTWEHTGSLNGFTLERFIVGTDSTWQPLADLNAQDREYDDSGLPVETIIMYRIRAERNTGEVSDWVEVQGETEADDELTDVYNFHQSGATLTDVFMDWEYDGTGNTGFQLALLIGPIWINIIDDLPPEVRTVGIDNSIPDTTYSFRIRAFDADGSSSWDYTDATTDRPVDVDPPDWINVPNFVADADDLPWSQDMNDYVSSDSELTNWSIPNFTGVSIDDDGILTVTQTGDWSMRVTVSNDHGSSTSNFFSLTIGDFGDVHYAPARMPLRINNPRPFLDGPTGRPGNTMQAYSRYRNTHSQVPYEVPIGVGGGRPPFRFDISGNSAFTITPMAPPFNPGMTTWAEVHADAGAAGTYTVTVTDMDNAVETVTVTVTNDDSMFCFISPDGDDGNDGSFGSPIETTQEWYGATRTAMSRFQGKLIVYREGAYELPRSVGYTYYSNCIWHSDELKPMVHFSMPGEEVSVYGYLGSGGGFQTNDGSSAPTRDLYWAGITWDGSNGMQGGAFGFHSGAHRHVFWKMKFTEFRKTRVTHVNDNVGACCYLSRSTGWASSSLTNIDIEYINWVNSGNNYCGWQTYGSIHANLDWVKMINCTRGAPQEIWFNKGDAPYTTITSADAWWTSEYVNRVGRSLINWAPYHLTGSTVGEDYGVDWWNSTNQVRYCRFYQDPDNQGYQNMRLVDSGTNRITCKTWMDRCTNVLWADSTSGPLNDGVGTNPVVGRIPPELDRCYYFAANPWSDYKMPTGYIKTDTVEEPYNRLSNYINEDDGTVKDAAIKYQMGYEVPPVIATKFFGAIDHDDQLSEED